MKMTSLKINGRTVSRLSINGREVALGSGCDALCFTAKYNQATLRLSRLGNPDSINLQTSFDGSSWTPYNVGDTITINSGGKVYFKAKGSNYRMAISPSDYHKFEFTSEFEASGNVNSLLEENEEVARTMSLANREMCYANLFSDTNLTTAPELPATELAFGCYGFMFHNCAYLTKAPELPAADLADNCYYSMFSGCGNLKYVKVGFDDWNPQSATVEWLPENYGTFECSRYLINNTNERSTNTVPNSWNMVAV